MIRLPKEINKIMKTVEDTGFQIFIVGGSIRDMLLGIEPVDWDLATDMPVDKVAEIFENTEAKIDENGEKYGVVRIKEGNLQIELATFRIDGHYSDHRRPDRVIFTDDVAKDLVRRDFTINGMAFNPRTGTIDPYGGQNDLKDRLIRTIGNPDERFTQDPLRILRGVRLAGQLNFDLEMETFSGMQKNACLLEQISTDRKRMEFERLLITGNAGKALRMCVSANILGSIFGDCYPPKGKMDNGDLEVLIQNIDRSRPDVDLRLALLLLCFEKKNAMKAIDRLNLGKERTKMQKAAQNLLMDLYFAADKYSLKRFIYLNGEDVYNFLTSVCKQQREVYDTPGYRIESRYYLLDDIKKNKEPIFVKDLAINGSDLIEAGIVQGEKVGEMLSMLIDVVHRFPGLNTKTKLLKKSKSLKNPIRAKFRNIYLTK